MNHTGRTPSVFGGRWGLILAALTAWALFAVFAPTAEAQETTSEENTRSASRTSDENLTFQEAEDPTFNARDLREQATQAEAEPLDGAEVNTRSTDEDNLTEIIDIAGPNCAFEQGASVVLEDDDGTQADFIDNVNVQITETRAGLRLRSDPDFEPSDDPTVSNNIQPLNPRGGDNDTFDNGGYTVITSTDITCEDIGDDGTDGTDGADGTDGTDGTDATDGTDGTDGTVDDGTVDDGTVDDGTVDDGTVDDASGGDGGDGDDPLTPEPQDDVKGPLAGGTAKGQDVLVKDDNNCGPQQQFDCIDRVVIQTENCRFTTQGENLTVTLRDPAGPFRLRDGDNVNFTIDEDGTIFADGLKVLGDSFPAGQRDNPNRVIIPIPVDPENFEPDNQPNDTFPIVSSTGIGGEGCQVLEPSNDSDGGSSGGSSNNASGDSTNNASSGSDSGDDVVQDTVPDKPLPKTGGPVILVPGAALLLASGLVGFVVSRRRSEG